MILHIWDSTKGREDLSAQFSLALGDSRAFRPDRSEETGKAPCAAYLTF